ncbi:PilZ domain-containing protein [Thalassotalea sp. M1531]|uniref:PilZ domain-containing protein n=1 Tax=Thalassotalea algicola TaxID=2716224 RepID=A0A7Y0LB70_9GAMM|nr:PilZ domain-containing protein [Thalassotalea algicola]NMP31034.1 PilZ domain-containing protein [Thalassotalea algicola]
MSENDLQTKLQQFDEFFSIEHNFNINLRTIADQEITSHDSFLASMPLPFKMASDIVTLDQAALRPIQSLSGVASQLTDFLNHQAHKIDLLVGYILSQQDEETMRYQGNRFGGGGVVFSSDKTFTIGQRLEMKIFLLEENCAVFCIGELVECQDVDTGFNYKVVFEHIREEDQETLVRHSLHQQSRQLQALAQKRRDERE